MFTRVFLALALLGCLAAATDPSSSSNSLRSKKKNGKGKKGKSDAAPLHADIKIKGLKKNPSPNEIAMIDDAIRLALNDGHKDSDYTVTDVVNEKIWVEPDAYTLFDAQAGNDSSLTDEPYYYIGSFFIYALINFSCNLCNEDPYAMRQFELTGPRKSSSADEKEVCELLRGTGVENFADAHGCSIKFVHKKAASAFDLVNAAE
jgi:hypothetical protein